MGSGGSRVFLRLRICGAWLQKGMLGGQRCPPEGGRYIGSAAGFLFFHAVVRVCEFCIREGFLCARSQIFIGLKSKSPPLRKAQGWSTHGLSTRVYFWEFSVTSGFGGPGARRDILSRNPCPAGSSRISQTAEPGRTRPLRRPARRKFEPAKSSGRAGGVRCRG